MVDKQRKKRGLGYKVIRKEDRVERRDGYKRKEASK